MRKFGSSPGDFPDTCPVPMNFRERNFLAVTKSPEGLRWQAEDSSSIQSYRFTAHGQVCVSFSFSHSPSSCSSSPKHPVVSWLGRFLCSLLFDTISVFKVLLIVIRARGCTILFLHILGLYLFCFRFACCSGEATADFTRDEPPAVVVVVLYRCTKTLDLGLR
jgi:hypothetical protein